MNLDRRRLFAALAGAATAGAAAPALARDIAARPATDATALGLRPNAPDDQSKSLAARHRPGRGRRHGPAPAGRLLSRRRAEFATPRRHRRRRRDDAHRHGGRPLDAVGHRQRQHRALTASSSTAPTSRCPSGADLSIWRKAAALRIADCEIVGAGRNGIALEAIEGEVTGNTVSAADTAIFSIDARGLRIAGNTVRGAGNGGILVWRSTAGDDGTLVVDNRIENIANKSGGSGQYGNGINVFRANNVMVRGNRIRNAAFSAVRGNAASNLQILGNTCSAIGEVALYAEFGFEGAMIANNIVDGAALGVSVTNFNEGGRLAVVQGNLIRNLLPRRPAGTDPNDGAGIGIGIEADTAVSGNVIENAPYIGIAAGWGQYLRDVTINANVVRGADYGIAVSVAPGAGAAVIADNMISGARLGAIVGMEWKKPVTGDLAKDGAERYAQLSVVGNRVR